MNKFIIFLLSFAILSFNLFSQNEPDPFAWDNNRISAPDINSDSENLKNVPDIETLPDDNLLPAMQEASQPEEKKEISEGKQTLPTPTPTPTSVIEKESMFKEPISIEEKEKTKEQIEKDVQDLFKEGKKYYDIEDYEGAADIWARIIQNYPTSKQLYDIRYALANAYEYSRNYDKAIVEYQKVLAEKPNFSLSQEATYRLAGCYEKLEKWPYAIEIYKEIIRKNKGKDDAIRAYFRLAMIYMKKEDFKKTETIYKNVMRYYPGTLWEIQARFQLASTYAQTHRYKSAIKEYKLIKYKFKDTEWAPIAAMHIGDTYKLSGDYKNAKEAYSRVIYEYFSNEKYVQQAEERIKALQNIKEIEKRVYEE